MSKHGQNHNEQNPLDTMERNDTRTPQEVLESAEAVKARLRHSEVEGLVEWSDEMQHAYDSILFNHNPIEADKQFGKMLESVLTKLLTTHGAKERGEGFNEGMKAVRCQTAEEAYERGRGDGMGLVSNALRAEYGDFMGDGIRVGKVLHKLGILTPQTDVTKN